MDNLSIKFQYGIDTERLDYSNGQIFISLYLEPLVQQEICFVEPKKWKSEIQLEAISEVNRIVGKLQLRVSPEDGFTKHTYDLGMNTLRIDGLGNSMELRWQFPGPESWRPIIKWHNKIIKTYFTDEVHDEYLALMRSSYFKEKS